MIFPTTLGPKNIFEVLRYFVFHRGGWGHQKSPTFSPWQSPKLEHLTHPPPPPRAVWESPDPMGGRWESTPLTTLSRISGGAHFWVKSFSLHPRRRRRFLCAGAVAGGGQPPFPHQAILYSPAPAPPPYLPATSAHHPPIVTLVLGGGHRRRRCVAELTVGGGGGPAVPRLPSAGGALSREAPHHQEWGLRGFAVGSFSAGAHESFVPGTLQEEHNQKEREIK